MLIKTAIIRKLPNGKYRLYSRKKGPDGKRRNLGTYNSLAGVKKREREVQTFKHHTDDGAGDDKETKALSKLSDIAGFLEEAGFIDASQMVYDAMCTIDSGFEDALNDSIISKVPDKQMNYPGSGDYMMTGEPAGGMQGAFSIPEAEKVAELADKLDRLGLYKEADELDKVLKTMIDDEMLETIKELEHVQKRKRKQKVKRKHKSKKRNSTDVMVGANGHVGTGVTDNQNAGMFQGFSDAYFYSGYGNLEGPYK